MKQKFIALFSGFPNHHFPKVIAERLQKELTVRENLVFISAWPSDYERTDEDSKGMYEMLKEFNLSFNKFSVIDYRTESSAAVKMINEASCIWQMGGNPTEQMKLIRNLKLAETIADFKGVILGVSAGSMNLAKCVVDVFENLIPYEGIGITDFTLKSHFKMEKDDLFDILKQVSMERPIYALQDESAIFINSSKIDSVGNIYLFDKGNISPVIL